MREGDVAHRGRGMDCFSSGENAFTVRLRARHGACARVTLVYTLNKFDWWQALTRTEMPRVRSGGAFDYFSLDVRGADSRLAYIFEFEGKDGLWYYSEEGLARAYDHSLSYFTYFQYPFSHACDRLTVPEWTKSAVTYQIFPERFCNGLGEKEYVNTPWDAPPRADSFYGGDLPGIAQKLDYIAGLGVTCLYLTPVFPSISNHKYDVMDYYEVDAAFGGKDALRALVRDARARGVRVVLDGVFNHCSSRNALFRDVMEKGRASRYYDWFFIDGERPDEQAVNYRTFGSVPYMPKLNTGNPAVIAYFCQVAAHWIREFGIAGWRLDVSDEISDRFLRALREAVKAADPEAILWGEVWHESAHWLQGDMLDGVMNYGLTKACLDYLAFGSISAQTFCERLCRLLWRNTDTANALMLNLMGSHDTERFLTRVRGDVSRLKMAYACAFFFPGVPCVYYGDEVGVEGGYDPGCRRGFPWDEKKQNTDIQRFIRRLAALKKLPALQTGACDIRREEGMPVIARTAAQGAARLYLNPSARARTARFEGQTVRVPANDLAILLSKSAKECT